MSDPLVVRRTTHQPFPRLGTPMIDPRTGAIDPTWHRLLVSMWTKQGLAYQSTSSTVILSQNPDTGDIDVILAITGEVLGTLPFSGGGGGPAVPQVPVASPFTFVASQSGTLVASAGKVELSRDSGTTYYQVYLTGGAVPVLLSDRVRVTWYGLDLPVVTFFPG